MTVTFLSKYAENPQNPELWQRLNVIVFVKATTAINLTIQNYCLSHIHTYTNTLMHAYI